MVSVGLVSQCAAAGAVASSRVGLSMEARAAAGSTEGNVTQSLAVRSDGHR